MSTRVALSDAHGRGSFRLVTSGGDDGRVRTVGRMSSTPVAATRISTAELSWLLSLRPGRPATLVAAALDLPLPLPDRSPEASVLEDLLAEGRAQERRGEVLPRGESAVVGDALTSATALISVGDEQGLAALLAVGADRVLLLAPAGAAVEVAALDAATTPGAAVAALASSVGQRARVMVALADAEITAVEPGPQLADRVDGLLR